MDWGPRHVRIRSDTILAAVMLPSWALRPWTRSVFCSEMRERKERKERKENQRKKKKKKEKKVGAISFGQEVTMW